MRYTALLLTLLLAAGLFRPLPAKAEGARSLLLLEAATGSVLREEHAAERLPVGSLAKLMTACLTAQAIESGALSPDTVLTAGDSVRGISGAVIWLVPGDTATVEELLLGLLTGNANDAAQVLAEGVSGDAEHFVMDMNAAAFDLGMRDTRFTSPQGYDDPEAFSTAMDMGKLACAVLRHEVLHPALSVWRTVIREDRTPAELVNENRLTRTYDGCCGLKAAHSEVAGWCLMAAAQRGEMVCVAIVLGCGEDEERFALAKQLLNEAFSGFRLSMPGYAEEFLLPLKIRGGTENAVLLEVQQTPLLAIPAGAQPEAVTILPEYWTAPLQRGTAVGRVCFYDGDTLLCETALLAAEDVPVMTWREAFRTALRAFFR